MTTREKLAVMLEEADGEYVSGGRIAESLGITRAAIWKNIRQLEAEGYSIEAVTGRGYRLGDTNDVVSSSLIKKYLQDDAGIFTLEVVPEITSTNTVLKEKAAECPSWYILAAGSQSAGRGRTGRGFFSPCGTGLYLSILLRPDLPVTDSGRITTAVSVAACLAIEECTDAKPKIKWVNDVFVNDRKTCGILTEASVNFESGELDWVVTGIGFNVYEPEDGFPEEISSTAGAICQERSKDLRSRLAASFIRHFYVLWNDLKSGAFIEEYRRRCFLLGHEIYVLRQDARIPAAAVGIDDNCGLIVRYDDGTSEVLSSGEVSVRPAFMKTS